MYVGNWYQETLITTLFNVKLMKLEIYVEKNLEIDIQDLRNKVVYTNLDFSPIKNLVGDKKIMEDTFQQIKKELIDGYK
jgi:hypothetical protein